MSDVSVFGLGEFFDTWGRLWYPDSWTRMPSCGPVGGICLLLLFIGGIASIFIFIGSNRWLIKIAAIAIFVWSLPILISGLIGLLIIFLVLALIGKSGPLIEMVLKGLTPTRTIRKRDNGTWDVYELGEDDD